MAVIHAAPKIVLDDAFERRREAAWLIYDTSRLLTRALEKRVREVGIGSQQWRILIQLAREDGQTQSHLALEAEIAPAPLGRLLDRLEEQKIIERRPDPLDRRAKRVYLAGGEQGPFFERLQQLAMQEFETVYRGVSEQEVAELLRLMQKLKANMLDSAPALPQS